MAQGMPTLFDDSHQFAVYRMATDRCIDHSLPGVTKANGPIFFINFPLSKLRYQSLMGQGVFGSNKDARSVFIKAMNNAGAQIFFRDLQTAMVEQRVYKRACPMSYSRMDDHAYGFIDR